MQKIQYLPVTMLKVRPDNPRRIDKAQLKILCESIKANPDYFETRPILCNKDFSMFAGTQRCLAAKRIGMKKVPVAIMDIPEERQREIMLRDNRQNGEWDFSKLKFFDPNLLLDVGFTDADLSNLWSENLEAVDDNFDEQVEVKKIKKTEIRVGDVIVMDKHRLICGSSLDLNVVKTLMGDVRANMINDDVPFNIDLDYDSGIGGKRNYGGTTRDNKTDEEYQTFIRTIMQNALWASKPDCHVFFWCDEKYVWLFQTLYKELGVDSRRLCVWLKNNASPTPTSPFNKVTEFCVYGSRGRPFLNTKLTNLNEVINPKMTTGNELSEQILDSFNAWVVKRLPSNQYEHPTQKSPELYSKALRRCSKVGDVILDLTAGSGALLSACHQLKRVAYLSEIEPIFCQLIVNRFQKLTGKKAKIIHTYEKE